MLIDIRVNLAQSSSTKLQFQHIFQYKAMLISLSVHLLLLMFELLVADNLGANRHLWILVNQSINKNILYLTISPTLKGLCREMNNF
jgi:hypothetical protein